MLWASIDLPRRVNDKVAAPINDANLEEYFEALDKERQKWLKTIGGAFSENVTLSELFAVMQSEFF